MRHCPLGAPCEPAGLTRFLPRQLDAPTDEDTAELGRLIASARRRASVAFLETLLPRREPAYMAEGFDDEEADEVRQLIGAARRDASIAALTPRLAAALAPDSGEALEAIALSGHAKRPRVAGLMKLIAGRLAAEAARAKPGPAVANGMPVQLVNLQSRPDLNGTCGTLIAFVPETGRYKVRLDGEDQPLAVRATNMKLLGAPTVAGAAPHPFLADEDEDEGEDDEPKAVAASSSLASSSLAAEAPADHEVTAEDCIPPAESMVLVLACPGTLDAAHEVGGFMSGGAVRGLGPLPPPLASSARAYPWLVQTRYYTATLWLLVHPLEATSARGADTDASAEAAGVVVAAVGDSGTDSANGTDSFAPLRSIASKCGGLVVFFEDDAGGAGWAALTSAWSTCLADATPESDVDIVLGLQSSNHEWSDAVSRERTEWALDHGVELLYANVRRDGAAAAAAAARVTRGESASGMGMADAEGTDDAEGLSRLVEALQCRVWPSLDIPPCFSVQEVHEASCEAKRTALQRFHRARRSAVLSERDAIATRHLEELAGEEPTAGGAPEPEHEPEPEPASATASGGGGSAHAERELESMEKLMEKMAFLREKGSTLSDEERRAQATRTALEMAKLMGEDDEGEDDDEDD